MPEPQPKSPEIDLLLQQLSGTWRPDCIRQSICAHCKGPANCFTDDLSEKEYRISGLCQECQNKVFGDDVFEED